MARQDLATPFMQGLQIGANLMVNLKKIREEERQRESTTKIEELKQQTELVKAGMDQQKKIADVALQFVANEKIMANQSKVDVFNKAILPFLNSMLPADKQIQPLTEWNSESANLVKAMQEVNNLPDDVPSNVKAQALTEHLVAYGLGEQALKQHQETLKLPSAEQQEIAVLTPEELRKRALKGTEEKPEIRTGVKIDDQGTEAAIERDPKTGAWNIIKVGSKEVKGRTPGTGKVSADERNAAGYYGRMEAADKIFNSEAFAAFKPSSTQFAAANALLTDKGMVSLLPTHWLNKGLGNEAQQYYQAAADWVRAKLRKESGAAIGAEEMLQEIRTYFPMPGEGKNVVMQKKQARAKATEQMKIAAGAAIDSRPALDSDRYK